MSSKPQVVLIEQIALFGVCAVSTAKSYARRGCFGAKITLGGGRTGYLVSKVEIFFGRQWARPPAPDEAEPLRVTRDDLDAYTDHILGKRDEQWQYWMHSARLRQTCPLGPPPYDPRDPDQVDFVNTLETNHV